MADISRRTIIRSLKKKGFVHKEKGDHDWYVFCHGGREYKQIVAKVSRGSGYKTYSQSLWTQMRRLLALDKNQDLHDLLLCPMNHETYLDILRDKSIVR